MFTNETQTTNVPAAHPLADTTTTPEVIGKHLISAAGVVLIGLFGLVDVGLRIGHFFGRRFG